MSITGQIDTDLKAAMKNRDKDLVSCLRLVRAALQAKHKDLQRELEDAEEIQILGTLSKQRQDSIKQFIQGGRQDLADKEAAELKVLKAYLPAQLDEAQITAIVDEVFADLQPNGMKDMGQVMKQIMARTKGAADGKTISQMVKARLG